MIFSELSDKITVRVEINGFKRELCGEIANDDVKDELTTVQLLYKLLREYSGIDQPWGLLTGVRPVKLFRKIIEEVGLDGAREKFEKEFL